MRRANAPSASASALGAAAGRERPQPAGGLEQRGGLQLAAPQVALDRDVRGVGVLALQQLARGERRAGVRERAQLGGVVVARELGERAREQQVAGRDRQPRARRPRPPWGARGAAGAPSIRSSWTSVAECTSSTATAARTRRSSPSALSGGPPRRLGREHDEQRAQPLAAGDDRGVRVRGERRAGLRGHPLQVELGARHPLAQLRAAAAHDRVEPVHARRVGPARRSRWRTTVLIMHLSAGTVPAWIATMPPAVSSSRCPPGPPAPSPPPAPRAREALDRVGQVGVGVGDRCRPGGSRTRARPPLRARQPPERRHDAVEPQPVEERQRRARRAW